MTYAEKKEWETIEADIEKVETKIEADRSRNGICRLRLR